MAVARTVTVTMAHWQSVTFFNAQLYLLRLGRRAYQPFLFTALVCADFGCAMRIGPISFGKPSVLPSFT
jgi:hypothetical protein